ncbi:MAG: hypothetical protein IJ899_04900 [Blautia sp.]|nr:hypothetical protein [Blautia sp.]
MSIDEYKEEISDCLYMGPWNELNPEKAITLLRMARLELTESELAFLYCHYVSKCFENSVKYGEADRDYYARALDVFQQMVDLLDKQETPALFNQITESVEKAIGFAEEATGWASGYDVDLEDMWNQCKWMNEWEN